MSTPISRIPDESGMMSTGEEDPALVQSILDEIGAMDPSASSSSASTGVPAVMPEAATPIYETFHSPPSAPPAMMSPHDDGILEFGDDGGEPVEYYVEEEIVEDVPPPAPLTLKERVLKMVRVPAVAALVVLLALAPPVQKLLRDVVVARLPVAEPVRAVIASLVLPALLVAVATGVAQTVFSA